MSDIEPRVPLEVLDPGLGDPRYWDRFQQRVMGAAQAHLARRRQARLTMGTVMLAWSRLVLPGTAVAAAAAAFILLGYSSGADEAEPIVGLEEVLWLLPEEGAEPLPSFLHSDDVVDRDVVLFAAQEF